MSDEIKKQMDDALEGASNQYDEAMKQMQASAMAMQEQMVRMQQQAFSGGAIDPQEILKFQQQAIDASGLGDFAFPSMEGEDEEEKAKAEFVASHPQPEGMSKYLALGSFFATMRDEPLETLEMMGDVEDYVEEMVNSWGIDGRESLMEMLESLIAGRHYQQTNDTYLAIKSGKLDDVSDEDAEEYQSAVEALRGIDLSMKEINTCPSVLAWDLERAAYLTRTGTYAEYITKDEAWNYLQRIAALVKESFTDWTQYGISIVMGRAMHMGHSDMYIYVMQGLLDEEPEFLAERPISSF